jgi:hypothetical protein
MKKSTFRLFILSNVLLSSIAYSQVGINTETPQATLDINSPGNTASTKSMRITNSSATETVTVTDQGRVGIGATVPQGQLHVATPNINGIISERGSTGATQPPYIGFRRNRSVDLLTNTAVQTNDLLGALTFSGNTGNGYEGNVITSFSTVWSKAAENFTTAAQGSNLEFSTVPVGTATNAVRMTITDQGRVGIGKTVPDAALHVSHRDATGIFTERSSVNDAPSYINFRKNKSADPATNGAVVENDALGIINFQGNSGNGYLPNIRTGYSSIEGAASENFTDAAQGSRLVFYTVPTGTVAKLPRMTISSQGRVGIGSTTPQGQFHVNSTAANGIISERASTGASQPPYFNLRRNRSTDPAVNGAVTTNDVLGAVTFAGNSGSGYTGDVLTGSVSLQAIAIEPFTATAHGSNMTFHTVPTGTIVSQTRMTISSQGLVGIGRTPTTNLLEVNGNASKTSAGAFIANSDARLKKDIQPISGEEALNKLTKLEGVTYYWNDDKTGIDRPKEKQIGFIAQNIQKVFPDKVTKDKQGYLQTAYGDYDAIFVESIKALNEKITQLTNRLDKVEKENTELKKK